MRLKVGLASLQPLAGMLATVDMQDLTRDESGSI
jgi:hypothetical protein